jgi:hypothetical protein
MSEAWIVNSDFKCQQFHRKVDELYKEFGYVTFEWMTGKQRTESQNNAMQLWCAMVAITLNDAGMEMTVNIPDKTRKPWTVPWTQDSVREQIWRPVQIALTNKKSTKDAERTDYNLIYEVISRRFAESFGLILPLFPNRDRQR